MSELPHVTFIYKETGCLPFQILNTGLKGGPDFYAVCIDGKYYLVQAKVKFGHFTADQLVNSMVHETKPDFATNTLSLAVPKTCDVAELVEKLQIAKSPFQHHFVNGLDDPNMPEWAKQA